MALCGGRARRRRLRDRPTHKMRHPIELEGREEEEEEREEAAAAAAAAEEEEEEELTLEA